MQSITKPPFAAGMNTVTRLATRITPRQVDTFKDQIKFSLVAYDAGTKGRRFASNHLQVANVGGTPVSGFRCWVQRGEPGESEGGVMDIDLLYHPADRDVFGNRNPVYQIPVGADGIYLLGSPQGLYFALLEDYPEIPWEDPGLRAGYYFWEKQERVMGPLMEIARVTAFFRGE